MLALLVSAMLAGIQGGAPLPRVADVRDAVESELNSLCGGQLETESCTSHPSSARVRGLSCARVSNETARCRYRRHIASALGGNSSWRAADTTFRFDAEARLWRVVEDRDVARTQN